MTIESVLTPDERDKFVGDLIDYGTDFVAPLYAVVESIEAAVLASPEVQAWKKDAGLWQKLAGHVYEIKRTHEKSAENKVRRLQLDIRNSSISSTTWLEDAANDLAVSGAEDECQSDIQAAAGGLTQSPIE